MFRTKSPKRLVRIFLALVVLGGAFYGGYTYKNLKSQQEIGGLKEQIAEKEEQIKRLQATEELESIPKVVTPRYNLDNLKGYLISQEGNIIVEKPKIYQELVNSVAISGQARVFEAQLYARLKDQKGKILAKTLITVSVGAPEFGTYSKTLNFSQVAETQVGLLEVYTLSEKDGSETDTVAVPVVLLGR